MNGQLHQLLTENPNLWQGKSICLQTAPGLPTGYPALDAVLPGGGWPGSALTELITPRWGVGELRLLLPLMSSLTAMQRWLLWVSPPHRPYAPALANAEVDIRYLAIVKNTVSEKDKLWCFEKALQTSACGMAMVWSQRFLHTDLRRLQLAAESGGTAGFLFSNNETKNSPAALRIKLSPAPNGVRVDILKARGTFYTPRITIRFK